MSRMFALSILLVASAACGPPPTPRSLPADLPPPEYEPPRGFDLPDAKPPLPAAVPDNR